jgi:hypothetical protein
VRDLTCSHSTPVRRVHTRPNPIRCASQHAPESGPARSGRHHDAGAPPPELAGPNLMPKARCLRTSTSSATRTGSSLSARASLRTRCRRSLRRWGATTSAVHCTRHMRPPEDRPGGGPRLMLHDLNGSRTGTPPRGEAFPEKRQFCSCSANFFNTSTQLPAQN